MAKYSATREYKKYSYGFTKNEVSRCYEFWASEKRYKYIAESYVRNTYTDSYDNYSNK